MRHSETHFRLASGLLFAVLSIVLNVGCTQTSLDATEIPVTTTPTIPRSPGSPTGPDFSSLTLSVLPLYPNNGANWNQYVLDDGADKLHATDAACTPAQACIHGAVLRKVSLSGITSCADLAMVDSADAFLWKCSLVGSTATFYSLGFKPQKGLADLLTAGTWKLMSVTLRSSGASLTSATSAWWTNTVTALPDNSVSGIVQVLSTPGTIYILNSSRASAGYSIEADRIAVVTASGMKMSYANVASNNCNGTTGSRTAADTKCLIFSAGFNYLWIEGNFTAVSGSEANRAAHGILVDTAKFLKIQSAWVSNFSMHGIYLDAVQKSSILDSRVANTPGNSGVEISNSSYVSIGRLQIQNGGQGLYVENSDHVTASQVVSQNNDSYSIEFDGCTDCTSVANTTVGSSYMGHDVWSSTNFMLHNVLAGNSDPSAVSFGGSTGVYVSQVAALSSTLGLAFDTTTTLRARGNFYLSGNTTACANTTATSSDLDASCVAGGGVAAIISSGSATLSSVMKGVVYLDSVSPNATSGTVSFPAAGSLASLDWMKFDSWYRAFGPEDASFPSATSRAKFSTGAGRIYDARLLALDQLLLNHSNSLTTASGTIDHGLNCPSDLAASNTITLNSKTYLKNAIELLGYAGGNENGLCETGEICLYSPNYGAYQGEGDFATVSCNFVNGAGAGTVSGVTIYAYPTNGVN
jgi:hypothetical protein